MSYKPPPTDERTDRTETPPETPLDTARQQLHGAASYTDVDPNTVERLTCLAAAHGATVPLKRDDVGGVALSRIAVAHGNRGLWQRTRETPRRRPQRTGLCRRRSNGDV